MSLKCKMSPHMKFKKDACKVPSYSEFFTVFAITVKHSPNSPVIFEAGATRHNPAF